MSDYEKRVHEALEWAASFEDTSAATSRSERLHIALAIPHASFIPERVTTMVNLRGQLGVTANLVRQSTFFHLDYHEFTDREKWYPTKDSEGWFMKMLRWGIATEADWFFTLQDDVEVAPHFWRSLLAMLRAWPNDKLLHLAANHSQGPEVARQGRHSYFTNTVVGWAWGCPRAVFIELVEWCDKNLQAYRGSVPGGGEDMMVAKFCAERGYLIRHPCPTIADQVFVASTFPGNDLHTHRKCTVTWRDYSAKDMAEPTWWNTYAPELPLDIAHLCQWCGKFEAAAYSPHSKMGLCVACMPRGLCQWCGEGGVVVRAPATGFGICAKCFMNPGGVFVPLIMKEVKT